jgi:hypothetical protein
LMPYAVAVAMERGHEFVSPNHKISHSFKP